MNLGSKKSAMQTQPMRWNWIKAPIQVLYQGIHGFPLNTWIRMMKLVILKCVICFPNNQCIFLSWRVSVQWQRVTESLALQSHFVSRALWTRHSNVSSPRGHRGSYDQTYTSLLGTGAVAVYVCPGRTGAQVFIGHRLWHVSMPAPPPQPTYRFHSLQPAWVKYCSNYKTRDIGRENFRNDCSKLLPFFSSQGKKGNNRERSEGKHRSLPSMGCAVYICTYINILSCSFMPWREKGCNQPFRDDQID